MSFLTTSAGHLEFEVEALSALREEEMGRARSLPPVGLVAV